VKTIFAPSPAFDPSKLEEEALAGVYENWRQAMRLHRPCEGLRISCIDGRPDCAWSFKAEGPPAFSASILFEGRMQMAFDDGAVLEAEAGSAILMATGQYATGWNTLDCAGGGAFRMVSVYLPQPALAGLIGLQMDDLRRRVRVIAQDQPHIDATLGVTCASGNLQRIADDLLSFNFAYPGACVARDLYRRAKAFEIIACFLHEHMARQRPRLPVPADRLRLVNARALLEKHYARKWSVPSLADAVGLYEKRLQTGFRALYGVSVHACLTRIRIDAAIILLQRGVSVSETAERVGFSHLSHFSRMFRDHTGITPKQCGKGFRPNLKNICDAKSTKPAES
jgi:AraC-like DNA-binding protein